jgi:arylsulfatase A-like enzyme
MTFKTRIFAIGLLSLVAIYSGIPNCNAASDQPPNIILIMSDDQGWGDAELAGNNIINTPNLNSIANNGVQFERFYVSPMCAPTRASIMTGRYDLRTDVTWVCRRTEYLNLNETTLAEILKEGGYSTGIIGKWHIGEYGPYHPNERGFDYFFGHLDGSRSHYYNTPLDYNGKQIVSDGYITDIFTDSALNFIDRNQNNPFFCFVSYNVPHHPFQAPEELYQKYKKLGVENDMTASVYGMVENMDSNIGRILKHLEDLNIDENTIVFFLSDNGPAFERFNDGLAGIKAQVGEGSVRVPFYAMWKGHFPEGKRIYDLTAHIDFLPTILDIAKIELPGSLKIDGVSFLPLLEGSLNVVSDRTIFSYQTHFGYMDVDYRGLRTNKYRLLKWRADWELYDIENDPSQKRNIALSEPELTTKLVNEYSDWYNEVTENYKGLPYVPVGYPGYDTVTIIAPDAVISGDLKYNQRWGWHPDWILNWVNTEDTVAWEIDAYSSGNYELFLQYNCKEEDVGVRFQIEGERFIRSGTIESAFYPPLIELPNNVSNKFSPSIKDWDLLSFGEVKLKKGKQKLYLNATRIPGKTAGEIKGLRLIYKN